MTPKQLSRFLPKVDKTRGGCWTWRASFRANGYGQFAIEGIPKLAHRVAYEHWNGPIPIGTEIDHLCRNRACVNPAHLEAVSHRVNVQRGLASEHMSRVAAQRRARTHCANGHEYTQDRTYLYRLPDGRVMRRCKTCHASRAKAWYHREVAA